MAVFNILHLTDLHYGLKEQESFFPNVRSDFFKDLKTLHGFLGNFDLVLFTGDLTQRGSAEEFQNLQRLLEELWNRLNDYGSSNPILLAVPGNHDLVRPPDDLPEVLILQDLAVIDRKAVWDDLINSETAGRYRQILDKAFEGYRSWWVNCPFRGNSSDNFSLRNGPLPGDFSAILEKDGIRLGIVGLNTTFLQLTNGNYKGKLAVNPQQFIQTCEGRGDAWFEDNIDACLMMTHQPPDWLAPPNRKEVFEGLIDQEGRFAMHFCGHMHEPMAEMRSLGWSQLRRLSLGGSLFGLETNSAGATERIHAYAGCRIEIPDNAETGTIRLWPRRATKRGNSTLQFDRDQSFIPDPSVRDDGTRPEPFPRLRRPPQRDNNEVANELQPPPFPSPQIRPDVGNLPVLDPQAQFRLHFIGRANLLRDFADALDGILVRAGAKDIGRVGRGGDVQLFWLHGFGGMGKSWFLRRAYTEAELRSPLLKVGLIDWHLPQWHQPANTPPDSPRELFNAIAYRLAQVYGTAKLDSYWEAERTVAESCERHRQLHDELDETLALLHSYGPNWMQALRSSASPSSLLTGSDPTFKRLRRLQAVLRHRNEWSDNPAKLQAILENHRASQILFDRADGGLFESWAEEMAGVETSVLKEPSRVLADTLRDCLRSICTSEGPLVLILDTCELLSGPLHSWLRRLLAPLLDGRTPILVLVGSRQRPDPYLRPGERGGWRDSVDELRLRIFPFDEDVRFTVPELELALVRAQEERPSRPLPSDPALGRVLHRVTLGVPLAFGTLLGLHWGNPPDNVLFELGSLDWNSEDELDQNRAVRKVIEVVAGRFLLHLENADEELRDITALALLRRTNPEILGKFWGTQAAAERLRVLAQRYALLADGDLHPTVREFLRRDWRQVPPSRIQGIAEQLLEALELTKPDDDWMNEAQVCADWELERLNVLAWLRGDDAYPDFIRVLATFLAANQDVEELVRIAAEILPRSGRTRKMRQLLVDPGWTGWGHTWGRKGMWKVVSSLEKHRGPDWTVRENASLDLVVAITLAAHERHDEAVVRFVTALDALGECVPDLSAVARAYFGSVKELGQSESIRPMADRALTWAQQMGLDPHEDWDEGYYWILHNAQRFAEAEAYCRKMVDADRYNDEPTVYLGHVIGDHLGRSEEAESLYLAAIALDDNSENLHYFYGQLLAGPLERPEAAEKEYRRALELIGESQYRNQDRKKILPGLARVLRTLGRTSEAGTVLRDMLALSPNDLECLNLLAWDTYLTGKNLDEAERLGRRTIDLEPDDLNCVHTLAAILIRRGAWAEAVPLYGKWVASKAPSDFKRSWDQYLPQFHDTVSQGRAVEMANLLEDRNDDPIWPLMRDVLRAIASDRREFSDLPQGLRNAAFALYDQILSPGPNPKFPQV